MRIYLIDDDELSNFVSAKTIEKSGISNSVIQFTQAKLALEKLRTIALNDIKDAPDIIFLDINMPEMNGWDFLDEYQILNLNFNKTIYIFLLTSSLYPNDIEKGKFYKDVVDYIPKPLNMPVLKEFRSKYFKSVKELLLK